MKKLPVLAALFVILCASTQAQANSILEFFYPMLKKPKYDASQTLEAPFADKDAIEKSEVGKGLLLNTDLIPYHNQ